MIWTDVIEEFPDGGYIHPLYDGQGWDGRKYRPVWHSLEGAARTKPSVRRTREAEP